MKNKSFLILVAFSSLVVGCATTQQRLLDNGRGEFHRPMKSTKCHQSEENLPNMAIKLQGMRFESFETVKKREEDGASKCIHYEVSADFQ